MEMLREEKLEQIRSLAKDYATAKSERIYLEQFRKSKKALLMKGFEEMGQKVVGKQERDAYAHGDYIDLITSLSHAVAREEELRWMLKLEEWKFEEWRSLQANERAERGRY